MSQNNNNIYLGFDFGLKRIGVAVGQGLTLSASPLTTIKAMNGVPNWDNVLQYINKWRPKELIVGLPTTIDNKKLYVTSLAKNFAAELHKRFNLPVHLVDERLSTVEARAYLFDIGGYRKIKNTEVDGIAACIILEQWLKES